MVRIYGRGKSRGRVTNAMGPNGLWKTRNGGWGGPLVVTDGIVAM